MLCGVVIMIGVFAVRDALNAYANLNKRVSFVEGYIGALDQVMRSR
jgi:hypothetical protein